MKWELDDLKIKYNKTTIFRNDTLVTRPHYWHDDNGVIIVTQKQ